MWRTLAARWSQRPSGIDEFLFARLKNCDDEPRHRHPAQPTDDRDDEDEHPTSVP